jgi:hypothetical protein
MCRSGGKLTERYRRDCLPETGGTLGYWPPYPIRCERIGVEDIQRKRKKERARDNEKEAECIN